MPSRDEEDAAYDAMIIAALRQLVDETNQGESAKRLGFSQGHISRVLRGETKPGRAFLVRLSLATGRSLYSILGLPEPTPQPPTTPPQPPELTPDDVERIAEAVADRVRGGPKRSTIRAKR